MKRLEDWPTRLFAYIAQRRRMPFAWGTHDCCQFARRAVEAITGEDPAAGLDLLEYTDAAGAAAYLAEHPIESIPAAAGLQEIPVLRAQRGDIVLMPSGEHLVLGVCLGGYIAGPGATELEHIPLRRAVKAWRV